jgi:hypothetical protein
MMVQSVSRVRALALRRSAFSLMLRIPLRAREHLLDRVEVGAVGRQVKDAGAGSGDGFSNAGDLVRGEVIHDHHVAR